MADILTKLSIICTVIGIALLIVVSDKVGAPTSKVSSLTTKDINKAVTIKGTVKSITTKGSALTMLDIQEKESSIKVVLFGQSFGQSKNNIKKGDFIEIVGRISIYKDELQIIADTVRL